MKEYQFQYTKTWGPLLIVLLSVLTFILSEFLGLYLKVNLLLTIVLSFGLAFLLFQTFKKKVLHNCNAKLSETFVSFEFEDSTKIINFTELVSYKAYYGKNGPVLYLKSSLDNFKIFSNNNFCKTDDFRTFCKDTISLLTKFKEKYNPNLIHEGSIFGSKGMLNF